MAGAVEQVIQVMIIDDDDAFRDSLQTLLNEKGNLRCEQACDSCEEALEILAGDYVPQIILLDIQLPGMSGIEGIRRLKSVSPVTPIIMLTVFDEDDKIFNAICLGAAGYLLKSASAARIHSAIEEVLCDIILKVLLFSKKEIPEITGSPISLILVVSKIL